MLIRCSDMQHTKSDSRTTASSGAKEIRPPFQRRIDMTEAIRGARGATDALSAQTVILRAAVCSAKEVKAQYLQQQKAADLRSKRHAAIAGGAVASATAMIMGVAAHIDPYISMLTAFAVVPALTYVLHRYFEWTEARAQRPGSVGALPRE